MTLPLPPRRSVSPTPSDLAACGSLAISGILPPTRAVQRRRKSAPASGHKQVTGSDCCTPLETNVGLILDRSEILRSLPRLPKGAKASFRLAQTSKTGPSARAQTKGIIRFPCLDMYIARWIPCRQSAVLREGSSSNLCLCSASSSPLLLLYSSSSSSSSASSPSGSGPISSNCFARSSLILSAGPGGRVTKSAI